MNSQALTDMGSWILQEEQHSSLDPHIQAYSELDGKKTVEDLGVNIL